MLSWLRKKDTPAQDLERQLRELEALAGRASNGYETQYLIRAGDLCARSGESRRALGYFGRALDRYLETGRLDAADALCRRMLDAAPDAVRVRGTLMWLTAARRPVAEVREAVAAYVRAGIDRNQVPLVLHQLGLLADAAMEDELREALAEVLLDLGAEREADRLFGEVFAERNGLALSPRALSAHEWGERMLEATVRAPGDIRERLEAA